MSPTVTAVTETVAAACLTAMHARLHSWHWLGFFSAPSLSSLLHGQHLQHWGTRDQSIHSPRLLAARMQSLQRHEQMVVRLWTGEKDTVS